MGVREVEIAEGKESEPLIVISWSEVTSFASRDTGSYPNIGLDSNGLIKDKMNKPKMSVC